MHNHDNNEAIVIEPASASLTFTKRVKKNIKTIPLVGAGIYSCARVVKNSRFTLVVNYFRQRIKIFFGLNKLFFYLYVKNIEYYQPLYGIPLQDRTPKRACSDRADMILQALKKWGQGGKILALGCSLGYMPHFFSERGYFVDGVDRRKDNIAVCNILKKIHNSNCQFAVAALDHEFTNQIAVGKYDFAFLLSVLHPVIQENGFEYTQNLLAELLEKVPVLIVELATRKEDAHSSWHNSLPDDELAVFAKCKNITIEKIGDIPNHLNTGYRPLYLIRSNSMYLCGAKREVYAHKFTAYQGAAYFGRHFYDCGDTFVKKYLLANCADNLAQIQHEISNYQRLPDNNLFPRVLAYSQQTDFIEVLFTKIPGENLHDLLLKGQTVQPWQIFQDAIQALEFLLQHGLYHNDVRLWNLMFDGHKTYLFDLGLARTEEHEKTNLALLWLIKQLHHFFYCKFPYPLNTAPEFHQVKLSEPFPAIVKTLQNTASFEEFLRWYKSTTKYHPERSEESPDIQEILR